MQHQAFSGAYRSSVAYVNPVFYSQLWEVLGRPKDKIAPSTGMLAIAMALSSCGRVSLYGFGRAGASTRCRHYWECPRYEDESRYYDPLHTFHDWLAEERLRALWQDAGLVDDGQRFGEGSAGAAAVRAAAGATI